MHISVELLVAFVNVTADYAMNPYKSLLVSISLKSGKITFQIKIK